MDTFKATIRDMVINNATNEEIQAFVDSVTQMEVYFVYYNNLLYF